MQAACDLDCVSALVAQVGPLEKLSLNIPLACHSLPEGSSKKNHVKKKKGIMIMKRAADALGMRATLLMNVQE